MKIILTVRDLNGIVLHQPSFDNMADATMMQAQILSLQGYNFPFHMDETGTIVNDFTVEIQDVTAKDDQEKINAEALTYLASTDWMVVRAMEDSMKPIPEDIKIARQAARDKVIK